MFTKVKAAFWAAAAAGLVAALDVLGAWDLGFLGSWALPAGAALAALAAWAKREIAGRYPGDA